MTNESLTATETTRLTCALEVRREYELGPAVTCSLCFALGLIYCFCVCVRAKQKQLDLTRIRPTRDRRPPALQRYTGDVLAPSYLASLRERQTHTGSSLWSLSSVHHTMIDFDSETGSLVPLTTSASALLRL